MAENKINDNVGKKIVEALKMQSSESYDQSYTPSDNENDAEFKSQEIGDIDDISDNVYSEFEDINSFSDNSYQSNEKPELSSDLQIKIQSQLKEPANQSDFQSSYIDNAFQQSIARNLGQPAISQIPDDFDYPANVAVLRQLISKLPAGVSKQTGATIIRQTMEALGISMQAVIQEAKQVQGNLVANSKECQTNIIEYKKQIRLLEAKSQQYKRQSAVMNDIINLFIQS